MRRSPCRRSRRSLRCRPRRPGARRYDKLGVEGQVSGVATVAPCTAAPATRLAVDVVPVFSVRDVFRPRLPGPAPGAVAARTAAGVDDPAGAVVHPGVDDGGCTMSSTVATVASCAAVVVRVVVVTAPRAARASRAGIRRSPAA